ncbi:cation:proton antiporter [Pseudoduganella ginsengisoli]|uniref:Cation/H+ exchanger transmembrane domain-containing protein n=1 Tax=Pseudoduganella ginsengisoli TaxID=1462440 RepID=A0A6L6Q2M5_9BURK|nr:cation:proton antiporter [Pseudoduganella ginsengisoli]MTW04087.1 hypothetical protein [Pseudoduganella ginsengisoli]
MTASFFTALLAYMALPVVLSKVFRIDRLFPLVFVQLVFGLFIHASGLDRWLQQHQVDLQAGPLASSLAGLGWVGVSLLVALTGAESAPRPSERGAWRFVPISIAGFGSTAAMGAMIGYGLYAARPELLGANSTVLTFCLAVGLSLSVTAMPVLVAILREIGMLNTTLGNLAVNCALLDDLWLWLSLAVVLALGQGGDQPLHMALALSAYLLVMFGMVRPLLRRWLERQPGMGVADRLLLSVSVIFMSSVATDWIGLHSIFGAFMAGTVLPRRAFDDWREPLLQQVQVLLLPFFFIQTGMRLDIHSGDPLFWQLTAIVTAGAVLGKFTSVALAARQTGLAWADSMALGSLMQCKGLMELVAINILLDAGIIGTQIFSALAMMALASTCITAPALRWLLGERYATPGMPLPNSGGMA